MFGGFQIARPYGIPLKLHWTLIVFLPFIALRMAGAMGISSLFWGWMVAFGLFTSVALHELGHAVVARGRGYPVRDIVLTPIGGVAFLARAPRQANDELVIALAGPAVSVALWIGLRLLVPPAASLNMPNVANSLYFLSLINLSLVVFNMLPCFPMDGGRVFRAWMTKRVGRLEATRRAVQLGKVFAVLFAIFGLFNNLFLVVIAFVVWQAAAAEYRTVQLQERPPRPPPFTGFIDPLSIFRGPSEPAPRSPDVIDVEVGPPPFEK